MALTHRFRASDEGATPASLIRCKNFLPSDRSTTATLLRFQQVAEKIFASCWVKTNVSQATTSEERFLVSLEVLSQTL